jgi:hypothetical protein
VKTIKIKTFADIPKNYTGIVVWPSGRKHWYLNGLVHREDGPAVVCPNGTKYWYLNGKEVNKQTAELYYMLKYKKVLDL